MRPASRGKDGVRHRCLVLMIGSCERGGPGRLTARLLQCQWEEDNPFLREWALWGVRNLTKGKRRLSFAAPWTECPSSIPLLGGLKTSNSRLRCSGSEAIAQSLRDMQVMGVVDSPELAAAGLRAEMDPETKKLRVVRREEPGPSHGPS